MLTVKEAEIKLNELIPNDIRVLSNLFKSNNHNLFLVGGAVRDVLLNKLPKDFDVATDANPDEIQKILIDAGIKQQSQGVDFGVIVAKMSEDIEIATFRTDESNDSGEMKDISVKFGATIEEDVKRRDLTINGLFFDISNKQIIDLIGGIDDLKNGIIRTIGKPEDRFKEDNLRKLRAIRFASRLGFKLDKDLLKSIKKDPSLNVSSHRVVNELKNSFDRTKSKRHLIELLIDTDLTDVIFQNTFMIKAFDNFEDLSFAEFIFLFVQDFDKKTIEQTLKEHDFSSNVIDTCLFLKQLDLDLKSNTAIDPNMFFKSVKRLGINNISLQFFQDFDDKIDWLLSFKPDKELVQKLMAAGFTGKALGVELERINIEKFIEKFKKSL